MALLEQKYGHLEEREKYRRMRISLKKQGKKIQSGHTHSPEMRRKISEKTRLALQKPEVREKMRANGHAIPAEVRKKIGESVSKTYANMSPERKAKSEEHRRKISESIRRKWADKEYRDKATKGMSRAMKSKWEDPEYREAKRASQPPEFARSANAAPKAKGSRSIKPASISKEAAEVISQAQKIQETRTKLIRIANIVEQLAGQQGSSGDPKIGRSIEKARGALDELRATITSSQKNVKVMLGKYLDVKVGKLSRRALMSQVFEQFELSEIYEEVVDGVVQASKIATMEKLKTQSTQRTTQSTQLTQPETNKMDTLPSEENIERTDSNDQDTPDEKTDSPMWELHLDKMSID
eukprot:CAMPEP_0114514150 /NCGR_PEP_ID=MMETSP0109-20121206/15986_1 /TAXON_ID=29199 /ORGANISM="Chlorarachnion reptans, Strain CCCM449" /LENGTH=352 /DNA_ID=CAMNT_0001694143 /DNA_START=322 /DNA_END=1380 /DNA_ORIENTATION=+